MEEFIKSISPMIMNNKKILWVTPWFGNYRVPVYEQINKLSNGNFHLICSSKQTSKLVRNKLYNTLGKNVIVLDDEKEFVIGNRSTTFANKSIVIKWQKGLYTEIKRINPDVIIVEGFGSWSPAGIIYSIIHRKKLCMFYERTAYVERHAKVISKLYRRFVGQFVKVFLVNGHLTEEYLKNGLGFRKTPIQKGCMAADSQGLSEAVAKVSDNQIQKLRNDLKFNKGLTYLFVGQIVCRKGIVELLKAWTKHIKKYPDDNLIVIGKGVLQRQIQNEYVSISSIHILGEVSYDKINLYYALADVFFMPTLEDNWCLVLPEAMACGLPVACSIYNGGTSELIENGKNGYAFDPKNENDILEKLSLFHAADLSAMGKQSILIESRFTPAIAGANIYKACLK